jgi:hypothetical protein
MFKSIYYIPGNATVKVGNSIPYAAVHNDGGTIHSFVTPAMRGHAWKEFFAAGGTSKAKREQLPPEAAKWKALALTKKKNLNILLSKILIILLIRTEYRLSLDMLRIKSFLISDVGLRTF